MGKVIYGKPIAESTLERLGRVSERLNSHPKLATILIGKNPASEIYIHIKEKRFLANKKYKLKTHKASAKRFKMTRGGKIMRTKGNKGHLRRNKSKRVKRQLSGMVPVSGRKQKKTIKRLVPDIGKRD